MRRKRGSKNSQAAAIGTICIETASTFKPVREAFWLDEEWRRRNLRYYPWYGRGYIQLTWESNYTNAGRALGIDLLTDPDDAMKPPTAAAVFGWYWCEARDIGPLADQKRWSSVRIAVQGGEAHLDRLVRVSEALIAA